MPQKGLKLWPFWGIKLRPFLGIKLIPILWAIFLQNHIDGEFLKKWRENRGDNFCDFVKKNS